MRIGVVTFPGSCDDRDARAAVAAMGGEPVALWHGDGDLRGVDAVVLPGGFSYGDYLRCGAIARFAPVKGSVVQAAGRYAWLAYVTDPGVPEPLGSPVQAPFLFSPQDPAA